MARSELVGSWFNSGFHGHFRSKSRTDFLCEYRHLAKPVPPKAFVKRSKATVSQHVFSRHDNRHSFMNDALYFEEGLGRRRVQNKTNRYQQDLLNWHPEREEFRKSGPQLSVYKVDYHSVPVSDTTKQKIVQRPKTSFDDNRSSTSYRYAHGGENPNKSIIDARCNVGLSTVSNRKQKASFITGRESVATCLNWHMPRTRSLVPSSTHTSTQEQSSTANATSDPATIPGNTRATVQATSTASAGECGGQTQLTSTGPGSVRVEAL